MKNLVKWLFVLCAKNKITNLFCMTDGILRFLQKTVDGDRLSGPHKSYRIILFTDVCEGWRQGRNGMFLRGDAPHQESSFRDIIIS